MTWSKLLIILFLIVVSIGISQLILWLIAETRAEWGGVVALVCIVIVWGSMAFLVYVL